MHDSTSQTQCSCCLRKSQTSELVNQWLLNGYFCCSRPLVLHTFSCLHWGIRIHCQLSWCVELQSITRWKVLVWACKIRKKWVLLVTWPLTHPYKSMNAYQLLQLGVSTSTSIHWKTRIPAALSLHQLHSCVELCCNRHKKMVQNPKKMTMCKWSKNTSLKLINSALRCPHLLAFTEGLGYTVSCNCVCSCRASQYTQGGKLWCVHAKSENYEESCHMTTHKYIPTNQWMLTGCFGWGRLNVLEFTERLGYTVSRGDGVWSCRALRCKMESFGVQVVYMQNPKKSILGKWSRTHL